MGYDMYRVGGSDIPDHEDYYRLNIWGMSEARPQLEAFGVVRRAGMPHVPQAEEFGVNEAFDFEEDQDLATLTEAQLAYVTAMKQWRDGHDGEGPGIPDYKLGSNDGWLVTRIEIESGVRLADSEHPGWRDKVFEWVLEFVVWMEGCKEGFRVY